MIIWQGWGFMVAVVVFGSSLLTELATESAFEDDKYYQTHGWPLATALAIAAVITWLLSIWLGGRGGRTLIDT